MGDYGVARGYRIKPVKLWTHEVKPYRRAGRELRQQAIERTRQEVWHGLETWGDENFMSRFNEAGSRSRFPDEEVRAEAIRRLSLLRAVDGGFCE